MYMTVFGHQPDLHAIIDMILTGFVHVDASSGRMFVEDEAFYTASPEAIMLFT